jgi:hypothetical protein
VREGDHLEDPDVAGRIIFKMNLREVGLGGWGHGLDQSGSGQRQVAGFCERENEPSGSIKWGGISRLAEDLLASQEDLYYMD